MGMNIRPTMWHVHGCSDLGKEEEVLAALDALLEPLVNIRARASCTGVGTPQISFLSRGRISSCATA